jgi:hypothetical protein
MHGDPYVLYRQRIGRAVENTGSAFLAPDFVYVLTTRRFRAILKFDLLMLGRRARGRACPES